MRVLDRIRYGDLPAQQLRGLSVRESEVLGYIAEGLTNRQIASQMHLAEKTVKTYVSSMLAKLGLQSRIQAAVLATQLETPASA
jgi:two-component system response regulator DevR